MKKLILILFLLIIVSAAPLMAQQSCPADVILALARAGSACLNTGRDQACFGNGSVTAQGFGGETLFSQTGNIVDAELIQVLQVGGGSEYSAAIARIQGTLPTADQQSVVIFAFGTAQITNLAPPTNEVLIAATGTLNVRTQPDSTAPIVTQVGVRDSLTANGRIADNSWLRVIVPQRSAPDLIGWVAQDVINVTGDVNTLTVIRDPETERYLHPFEVIEISTGEDDAPCAATPESGILLQTPNITDPVAFTINGQSMTIAGTVFMQASSTTALEISILTGEVVFADGVFLPAGSLYRVGVSTEPEPFDAVSLAAMPINNLPARFRLTAPITAESYAAALIAYQARFVTPTPPPPDPTIEAACRRTVRFNADLRAGAGTNYEIVNPIAAGTRIYPVIASPDLNGDLWYQLSNSNWISAAFVEETGNCDPLPITGRADAPSTNGLILETCESTNGPIRAGQTVTIEFVPPAYDNINDANNATRIDPGRIFIENRRIRPTVSAPIAIGSGRYIRTFSTTWQADSGTFRITGDRLTYTVICDIVVPVG